MQRAASLNLTLLLNSPQWASQDVIMKDMLLSLCSSFQADMLACFQKCNPVQDLGERVSNLEDSMGVCMESYNNMVDAHATHSEDIDWLKSKVADLEDHSRLNNPTLRDIPESVQPSKLPYFVQDLFQAAVPSLSSADLTIDRIHRIPKPSFLPQEVPRDVLLLMHYFQVKETVLTTFHKKDHLPEKTVAIQVLPDLSAHTLQRHRNLISITKALRDHDIGYQWKYPATLKIICVVLHYVIY